MTTASIFAVFEDFNDLGEILPGKTVEAIAAPQIDIGELREQAWTDGYLTGRQERSDRTPDQSLSAKLLTSLHELGGSTTEAVNAASLAVADLLVSTVIATTSNDWSATLIDRVRSVAERIKPALTVAPEYILRDERGGIQHFGNILDLSRALEEGAVGEDVTIRWQRGEATISRSALLEDIRDAVIPLAAGLVDKQKARHLT
jgi:hypothetical protein